MWPRGNAVAQGIWLITLSPATRYTRRSSRSGIRLTVGANVLIFPVCGSTACAAAMHDGLVDFGLDKESARTVDIATVCKNQVHLLAKRIICHGHAFRDVHSGTIVISLTYKASGVIKHYRRYSLQSLRRNMLKGHVIIWAWAAVLYGVFRVCVDIISWMAQYFVGLYLLTFIDMILFPLVLLCGTHSRIFPTILGTS
jgi:hypothetical protein